MPIRICVALCVIVAGCRPPAPDTVIASPREVQAIADTIRAVLAEYAAAWSHVTCEDQSAVMKFFDWTGPGALEVTPAGVTQYPGDSWPLSFQEGACAREREEVRIDSLIVRVLSRTVAGAGYTYTSTYFRRDSPPTQVRGSVLQLFHRTVDGWRSPVGMAAPQPPPGQ